MSKRIFEILNVNKGISESQFAKYSICGQVFLIICLFPLAEIQNDINIFLLVVLVILWIILFFGWNTLIYLKLLRGKGYSWFWCLNALHPIGMLIIGWKEYKKKKNSEH